MSLPRGDIVARRPPPTAKVIGSAGQQLVRPNFGCFIDAALTAPPATRQLFFFPLLPSTNYCSLFAPQWSRSCSSVTPSCTFLHLTAPYQEQALQLKAACPYSFTTVEITRPLLLHDWKGSSSIQERSNKPAQDQMLL